MDIGNLQEGNLKRQKENLNKTGGINTGKSIFDTGANDIADANPYAMGSRVEHLANNGPLMATRVHTQNPNDIALKKRVRDQGHVSEDVHSEKRTHSREDEQIIKAQPDLKEFSQDVMKKGAFTPRAKEAARHFFEQLTRWAGSFDDGGSGFYGSMGISSMMDCLYVDGMSLRNYLNEQYLYKTTGNPAQDAESVRNYVALLAARGEHILTLVRPKLSGDGAEVEYRNLYVDLSEVGEKEAAKARNLKEKGNQVRSDLKKRLDEDITENTGMAYRKAYGCGSDGFARIEKAGEGLKSAGDEKSPKYLTFDGAFSHYNKGIQKLGLKPGRDDINSAVAHELLSRCEEAIKAADEFISSGEGGKETEEAVRNAKKALETDRELLKKAIDDKLGDEQARMRLDELLDSGTDKNDGKNDGKDSPEGGDDPADNGDPGNVLQE